MNSKILVAGIVLLALSVIAIGCGTGISQQDYDKVKADYAQSQQELSACQGNLSAAQGELTNLRAKFPPHDFATVTALQQWVSSHLLPPVTDTTTAEDLFRAALGVQEAALADGYSMSVNIAPLDNDVYLISNTAMVAGQCYNVDPWTGQVIALTGFVR